MRIAQERLAEQVDVAERRAHEVPPLDVEVFRMKTMENHGNMWGFSLEFKIAMEPIYWWVDNFLFIDDVPIQMVIFHSYGKLSEGNDWNMGW